MYIQMYIQSTQYTVLAGKYIYSKLVTSTEPVVDNNK